MTTDGPSERAGFMPSSGGRISRDFAKRGVSLTSTSPSDTCKVPDKEREADGDGSQEGRL